MKRRRIKINHKKIYDKVTFPYWIYGQAIRMPKNYTCFWKNENDFNKDRPSFIIERIPKGKYLATLYIMLLQDDEDTRNKIDSIVNEYIKLNREPKDWVIDFNYKVDRIYF